ncbi:hypothetical protein KUTeg_006708 [Tegillarca granosa]|uniref:Uncharacterized protein n=1 Tax=Tegillarca granosa TaxID=220873 RepID=A0ABQ9FB32_TEGGR|nr:hypothetical protein KUTeg_006708 [Tegillarca granosa]
MQSDIHDTSQTGLHPSFSVRAEDLPFMDLMSLSLRKQIIQGKDVNLSTLLIPYYDYDRDKGDREKVKDEVRLKRQLNHSKFTTAFGRYKRTMGQIYPQRRDELDQYEAIMNSMYNAYGSKAYEYHKIRGSWDKSRLSSERSRFGTASSVSIDQKDEQKAVAMAKPAENTGSTTKKKIPQSTPKKKEEKSSCSTEGLQQEAQKVLTEKLLSKQRRTSPRKRPATSNPFDADHLDSFIPSSFIFILHSASSAAKEKKTASTPPVEMQIASPSVKERKYLNFTIETSIWSTTCNMYFNFRNASDSSEKQKVCPSEKQNEDYVSRREYKELQRKFRALKERIDTLERKIFNKTAEDSSDYLSSAD